MTVPNQSCLERMWECMNFRWGRRGRESRERVMNTQGDVWSRMETQQTKKQTKQRSHICQQVSIRPGKDNSIRGHVWSILNQSEARLKLDHQRPHPPSPPSFSAPHLLLGKLEPVSQHQRAREVKHAQPATLFRQKWCRFSGRGICGALRTGLLLH